MLFQRIRIISRRAKKTVTTRITASLIFLQKNFLGGLLKVYFNTLRHMRLYTYGSSSWQGMMLQGTAGYNDGRPDEAKGTFRPGLLSSASPLSQ